MDYFIIGDIHGCFHTLKKLLSHWDKKVQRLAFVGDLIDRGNFTPKVVELVRKLQIKHDAIVVLGNHECEAVDCIRNKKGDWFNGMGKEVVNQYKIQSSEEQFYKDIDWLASLPIYWENEKLFISHAGKTNHKNAYDKSDRVHSVVWTRKELAHIGKFQLYGHTPHKSGAVFNKKANALNIDTGCVYGGTLTACIFKEKDFSFKCISEPVNPKDID